MKEPELDGIRGLAISMVIFFHYFWGFLDFEPGSLSAYLWKPTTMFWSGVDLFFVLSGFLIVRGLLNKVDDLGQAKIFYARRACRILPLYSVMLLLFLLGVWAHRAGLIYMPRLFTADVLWPYFVFLQNFLFALTDAPINFISVSWSLAIEEQFYLLAPLLVLGAQTPRRAAFVFLAITAASLAIRCVMPATWWSAATPAHLDGIALGGLVAALWVVPKHRSQLERARSWAWPLLLLAALPPLIAAFRRDLFGPALYTLLAMFYALVLWAGLIKLEPLAALLRTPVLRWLGTRAYGLYLIHLPLLGLTLVAAGLSSQDLVYPRPRWITLSALAATVLLAEVSWRWLERPILDWGRRRFRYAAHG